MSRFFSQKYAGLVPYTPGEQPKERKYIKLNTNESPFPPSAAALKMASEALTTLQLYSDPECKQLVQAAADYYRVGKDEILFTNGSDEILDFAFMAFCDESTPAVFPDITYGFYSVFAELHHVPYEQLPLREDFTIRVEDYLDVQKTVFLANPNAQTGVALSRDEIERIVKSNPKHVVVVDEAYVDFGAESCVPLIHQYDNLLVTQTFSKSRSLAGARLGFGIGSAALIRDLNTIKYSTNPYNVNSLTMAAGIGALQDDGYRAKNCAAVMKTRAETAAALRELGFLLTDSSSNFLLARHPGISGKILYQKLRERGILVRHFDTPRLCEYNRITIGSEGQMKALLAAVREILEEDV